LSELGRWGVQVFVEKTVECEIQGWLVAGWWMI